MNPKRYDQTLYFKKPDLKTLGGDGFVCGHLWGSGPDLIDPWGLIYQPENYLQRVGVFLKVFLPIFQLVQKLWGSY